MTVIRTDLFTPRTWQGFCDADATLVGFRTSQRTAIEQVELGDLFLCYVVGVMRFTGVVEVTSAPFYNRTPVFQKPIDIFTLRLGVKPLVIAPTLEHGIPIKHPSVWRKYSKTRNIDSSKRGWAYRAQLVGSLVRQTPADGKLILTLLKESIAADKKYPLTPRERKNSKLK